MSLNLEDAQPRLLALGQPLEVYGRDGHLVEIDNAKHLALLAYLVLQADDYSRETLRRLVWSSGSLGSLERALSDIRKVVGDPELFARSQLVNLDPSRVSCDAADLLALGKRLDADAWRSALALYRGPFCDGFKTAGLTPKFVQWIKDTRAAIDAAFIQICERGCEAAAEDGRWSDILKIAAYVDAHGPAWEGAGRYRRRAEDALKEAAREPESSLSSPTAPPSEREPAIQQSRYLNPALLAGLLLVALIVFGLLRFWQSGDSGVSRAAGLTNDTTRECAPGEATANLVDEVFFYGTPRQAGSAFKKRWTLQNTGDCTWVETLRFLYKGASGLRLSNTIMDPPGLGRPVPPGDTISHELSMRAPDGPGTYDEFWELRDQEHRIPIGDRSDLVARVVVPRPSYPPCRLGEGSATLLQKKYADGTVVPTGETIRYSWTLKNDGQCAWGDGVILRYISHVNGRLSSTDSVRVTRSVNPFGTYTFLTSMRAPADAGVYQETWELRSSAGTVIPINSLPSTSIQLRVLAADVPRIMPMLCRPGEQRVRFLDENWPDGSPVTPGQEFIKRWTVVNDGTCAWRADYRLHFVTHRNGPMAISTDSIPLGEVVPPGAAYTFQVRMRAPGQFGTHQEEWQFKDNHGSLISIGTAPSLLCIVEVRTGIQGANIGQVMRENGRS